MAAAPNPNVSICQVLFKSPFKIFNKQQQSQEFSQVIKDTIAPHYRLKSITTLLMCISTIIYITLVFKYPPFIKIPRFTIEYLTLQPQNLKHYQFYRLISAPFVFDDLTNLIISLLIIWSLGSFTQQIYGWRMFAVFTGFYGLIGYSNSISIPCYLIGSLFAYFLMSMPDHQIPIFYRKVTLIIYLVVCLLYILIFISYDNSIKFSVYSATLYGFLLSFIFGMSKDQMNINTFRKVMQLLSTIVFIGITSTMIIQIIFHRKTLLD